ncbi:MAG: ester cyclase [Deltaproteobacteria bacterium]
MLKTILAFTLLAAPAFADATSDFVTDLYAAMEVQPYDADAMAANYADDYMDHNRPPGPPEASDKQIILGIIGELNTAMPNGRRTLNFIEPISDGRVVIHFTFDGTFSAPFYGMPPNGHAVHFNGVDIFRLQDGQVAEQWHIEEIAALMAQLSGQ